MPPRLSRLERIYVREPIYFVTACTAHRRKLLARLSIHAVFLGFAANGPASGAWIGCYVLMPDHFHVFVAIDDERISLSNWVRALKGTLSSQLRKEGVSSPFWQKGFFDHVLRSEESATQKWQYVRENPTRAGLVTESDDWPFLGEVFPLEYRAESG
ncbi:MAG TPA: transposase [Chthoniobacterales bacterium]|nr:transposase [Chthoniobacterales bacterium]